MPEPRDGERPAEDIAALAEVYRFVWSLPKRPKPATKEELPGAA